MVVPPCENRSIVEFTTTLQGMLDECEFDNTFDERLIGMCNIFDHMVRHKHLLELPIFADMKMVALEKLEACKDACPLFKRNLYGNYIKALSPQTVVNV